MFAARLATAVALLAVFVSAVLLLPNAGWAALLLPVLLAAAWEWVELCGMARAGRASFAALLVASALGLWLGGERVPALGGAVYAAGCAFWLVVAPAWLALRWRVRHPAALGLAGWLALVPAWWALVRLQEDPAQLLALLGVVWVSDTAAYLAGSAWGSRKLAPAVSPGKTWEGVAGAAAAVAVYYLVVSGLRPDWPWWQDARGPALVAGVALSGIVGDLFESWMKRQAGVKDSGRLLPGHGGILDRVDSMIASLPFAALFLLHLG